MLETNLMKKKKFRPVLAIVLTFILSITWFLSNLIWFKPTGINLFYERVILKYSLLDPQRMSQMGLLDKYHLDYYNDELNDPSINTAIETSLLANNELKILKRYDPSKQTESQLLSTNVLAWYLNNLYDGGDFAYNRFPVNQFLGVQKSLIDFMCNSHAIKNKGDAQDYVERLSKFDDYFEKLVSSLRQREEKGIIPPKSDITSTLSEMKGFVSADPKSNVLYTNLYDKVEKLNLGKREKEQLYSKAEEAISYSVYNGYKKLIAYYEELLPKSKDYVGVWNLPKGDEYYEYMVKSTTTLNITPEELFKKLEAEVVELNKKLNGLSNVSYTRTDKNINSIEDCQKVVDEIENKLPFIVTRLPKSKVQVKYSTVAASGVNQYFPGDINGNTPGTISVPEDFTRNSYYDIKWILYHEGIPGHHLQRSLAMEMKNVPTFRKVIPFTPFTEGWATYAQYLPWELGLTQDEGIEVDIIKNELFHLGRALIDIGINYKHWTVEEAIEFANKYNISELNGTKSLTQYYTVYPGMGLPYVVGCLKIRELRDYAKDELKDKFDIREFHDVVLKNGAIPLDILDGQVKKYVEEKVNAK